MIRKPYPPGIKGKRKIKTMSEYGKELREKQKLKNWYNLTESQFCNYIKKFLRSRTKIENPVESFIKILESRLDNVIFNLGFTVSRPQARQMISHGLFLINKKTINIPSYQTKKGDIITLKQKNLKIIKDIKERLKKYTTPEWLSMDIEKLEGKIIEDPLIKNFPPVEILSIFEYYSK